MTENLFIDLHDDLLPDNKKFFNLMDSGRWARLIEDAKEEGAVLEDLLEEMINGD